MKVAKPKSDGFLKLFQTEPRRSRFLAKVAGVGALLITLAVWLASATLSDPALVAITLFLVGSYATILMLQTMNLVRQADRWQVESALQTRRLLSRGRAAESATATTADTFHFWHFLLRLEEEIARCRRTGGTLSVVVLKVDYPGGQPSPVQSEQMSFDVAHLASNYLEKTVFMGALADFEYSFWLPNTDRDEARAKVAPLLNPLGDYRCDFGVAVYPADGGNAESLIGRARERFQLQPREAASA